MEYQLVALKTQKNDFNAIQHCLSQRQDPMTPTLGYIPNISGIVYTKCCHRSLAETATKCELQDIISL